MITVVGDWLHALDVRRSTTDVPVPGGRAVLSDPYPYAHDHNKLSVTVDTDGVLLGRAAEAVLGGAGRTHRLVDVRTADAPRADAGLCQQGYSRSDNLVHGVRRTASVHAAQRPVAGLGPRAT